MGFTKTNTRESLNKLAETIDEKLLKSVNNKMEHSKPAEIISLLETFVALLRNKFKANHVDVKLYLEEHSKLQFKLRTIDVSKLNKDAVTASANKLEELKSHFPVPEEQKLDDKFEFNVFFQWASSFANYAESILAQQGLHHKKTETHEKIANLKSEIRSQQELISVFNTPELVEYFNDRESKNTMLSDIGERIAQQMNIAVDAQSKYNNFEKRYFRDLNDERQLSKKIGEGLMGRLASAAADLNMPGLVVDVKRKSRF